MAGDGALPVLDRDHLSAMTSGDADLAVEVIEIFSEQAELWSRLLDPKKPDTEWADAAHSLKGAALSVGAMRLAKACEATEKLGRSGDASVAAAAVSIDAVRAELVAALEASAVVAHELTASGRFKASNAPNS